MACCLMVPSQSVSSCCIHLKAISQEMLEISILDMSFEITNFRLQLHSSPFSDDDELDESTARRQLKSPRSLSGRSLHLTLVTKWSRSHMTLKIQTSRSWPRSNPLSNLRPRVQIDMFAFRLVAIGPLLVEI